jgi:hypothetical protein
LFGIKKYPNIAITILLLSRRAIYRRRGKRSGSMTLWQPSALKGAKSCPVQKGKYK